MNSFRLHSPMQARKKGDIPTSPFVQIAVGSHSSTDNNDILLTPRLMVDSEIDHEIDALIKELEKLRVRAKKEVVMLRKRMLD